VRVDGHPQRIITLSSVRRVPRERWPTTRVDEHATALDDDCTALADEPMDAVLDRLARNEHHRVVVIADGGGGGIVTRRDLARRLERSQALGMTGPLDRGEAGPHPERQGGPSTVCGRRLPGSCLP